MHSLYVTGLGNSRLFAVKAIRDSLKVFDSNAENTLKLAFSLASKCDEVGYALLGSSDDRGIVSTALERLQAGSYATGLIDPTDADLQGFRKEPRAKAELSTIEANPNYAAAMVMLTMVEGNPLKAFAYAHSLASVSDAQDHYQKVMGALLLTFPWIMDMAKIGGLEVDWQADAGNETLS